MRWKPLVIAWVLLVGVVHSAPARTWYVKADGTGDAPTIQAAIDSATNGDVVLVAPGTYADTTHVQVGDSLEVVNVHLYKNIKLRAEGDPTNTTIGWSESDIAIYVSGVDSTAEIRGFRISVRFDPYFCLDGAASPAQPDFPIGIRCDDAAVVIRDNELIDHGFCIYARRSTLRIENNRFQRVLSGIECFEGSDAEIIANHFEQCGTGIICNHSAPEILNNVFVNGCYSVWCTTGGSAHIARNLITGMRTRAISVGEAAPLIEENEFRDNTRGLFIAATNSTPVIRSNVIHDSGYFAIWLDVSDNAVLENNTIDGVPDGYAIICVGSDSQIERNTITRAFGGIICLLNSSPSMECNNIFNVSEKRYAGDCSDQTGINGNISLDPQFCGAPDSGNYLLQADSPCAPGNHPDGHDCGQIGARGVGCGNTPVSTATWGSLKALFRKENSK
jgi:hypothetical protein